MQKDCRYDTVVYWNQIKIKQDVINTQNDINFVKVLRWFHVEKFKF